MYMYLFKVYFLCRLQRFWQLLRAYMFMLYLSLFPNIHEEDLKFLKSSNGKHGIIIINKFIVVYSKMTTKTSFAKQVQYMRACKHHLIFSIHFSKQSHGTINRAISLIRFRSTILF